ncbi:MULTISPECIES: hypothetical protein [unclassified Cryobacterium]|uniref:hypothetical protein n=1 Tax=unclassified Cryobacterium TaxID=2649013 RepID=UPI002AB586EE|nr:MULTISPECIES: hypothetical protein [unclassified Cryobacterium]MDY7529224.1 hypothetical protein [Cryobacterium sp. 10C2]MDY7558615.1 hypothetical protein [Cryobacterium sp. 10C3]MEB0202577.1 hypothetical protein [Cryobacterium sp. 5I3]MEB0289701.1 hypothetical protein [Cryobacterium sp. 10C2]MEB0304507.1 hypothetical protein [Cryobacterium sp. 10I1]
MGKASRLKADRAAKRCPALERQSPEDELSAAVVVVGELFGIEADCASAAGLLVEIGAQLGHVLRPRPVSVIIREKTTNTLLTMGPRASEKFSAEQLSRMENHRPGGRDTGHIVVTSDDHRLMLDPNMRQLGSHGINAPSIVIRVRSTEPESGEWEFSSETLDLIYIVDDGNEALLPPYENARRESVDYARKIADDIRAGVDPVSIAARIRKS